MSTLHDRPRLARRQRFSWVKGHWGFSEIAWELEPSPRSGGQGPAAATGRVRVLFTTVIGEIEREDALVIRAGSTWPIFDIATCSLCGCVSANGVGEAAE